MIDFNPKDPRNEQIKKQDDKGNFTNYLVHIRYLEGIFSNDSFNSKDDYVVNLKEIVGKSDISFNPSFLLKGSRSLLKG